MPQARELKTGDVVLDDHNDRMTVTHTQETMLGKITLFLDYEDGLSCYMTYDPEESFTLA